MAGDLAILYRREPSALALRVLEEVKWNSNLL